MRVTIGGEKTEVEVVEIRGEVIGDDQILLLLAVSWTRSSIRERNSSKSCDGDVKENDWMCKQVKKAFCCV
jgi:hypothetical protein